MTNLDSTVKSRDTSLPTKVCLVKAMVFPVVMYGCESWTIKKAKHKRIDAFELWRRLLWCLGLQGGQTSQSLKKSILNIHWKDWCWSWSSNTWYKEHSLEKTLMLGKIEGRRRRGRKRMRWSDGITGSMDECEQAPGDEGQGSLVCCHPCGHKELGVTERLNNKKDRWDRGSTEGEDREGQSKFWWGWGQQNP